MATSVTQSLFGMTPQAIQAQRAAELEKQALQFARLSPMESARQGLFYGVNQLGSAVGQALGYEDPEVAQARARQGMLSGVDMNNPESLLSVARQAQQAGDFQTAQALVAQANEVQAKQATVNKTQADLLNQQQGFQMRYEAIKSRFPNIPEAEARAVANSEASFNSVFKDQQAKLSSFAQQLVDEGLQPGTPAFQRRMSDFNQRQVSKKSLEETLGAGLTGLASALAGKQAEAAGSKGGAVVGEAAAKIESGFKSAEYLRNAKQMLDKGIFAGAYGPLGEQVSRFTMGAIGDKGRLQNTQEFRAYIGNTVMPMMAMLGGSDSNEELKKMEAILAANTSMEPKAMKNILDNALAAVERDIKRIQKQQEAVQRGEPLPTGPMEAPKPTRRFNRATGQLETIRN